jgi:ABC-type branched-subunit amino acid transport system ATPase component/ABC-type branched-subunit amino acid transport system permease subunit
MQRGVRGWRVVVGPLAAGTLLVFPVLSGNSYYLRLLTTVALYVLLATGLNVPLGQAGLLDMGYVGFFAVGAYARALLASPQLGVHLPFLVTWAVAVAAAVLLSVAVGTPTLRLSGDYLAIVTMGFAEIVRILLLNLDRPLNITNGPNGIIRIDPPSLGPVTVDGPAAHYYLMLAFAAAGYWLYSLLERSSAGIRWRALKDDPIAAESFGVNVSLYRVLAFAVGAAYASTAGILFASWQGAVFPQNFTLNELITLYCMVILGGAGNRKGVFVGAGALVAIPELLRGYSVYRMLVYGAILVLLMVFRPQGLFAAKRPPATRRPSLSPSRALRTPKVAVGPPDLALVGSSSAPALSVRNVSHRFGGLVVLEDVSFDLARGEVLGVIGPNGAGKTTLVNVISGLTKPESGECLLRGRRITGLRPHAIYRLGLSRTFQNLRLFGSMSAGENILVGAAAGHAVEDVQDPELACRLHEQAQSLTYPNRKALEIARALAGDPDVILFDEPAAGMSQAEAGRLAARIRGLKISGKSVVLIEHQMPLVMEASDRVIVLDRGRKVAEGPPARIAADPLVAQVYLGSGGEPGAEPGPPPVTVRDVSASHDPILELDGVGASYGPVKALRGVSLKVMRGEVVCLLGANGAGKTTVLKAIMGSVPSLSGRIVFRGSDILGGGSHVRRRQGMAIVPEGRRVFAGMTVEENLEMGAAGAPGSSLHPRLARAYSLFPRLEERKRQRAGSLSGGEQQMLAIARALMAEPELLLLDEPSMGLAPVIADRIFGVIANLAFTGTAVLLVEQNAPRALGIASRGYVLQDGTVVAQGPARDLANGPDLRKAYVAADHVERQS